MVVFDKEGDCLLKGDDLEIDEKVFDLYGLTPEEREIVKGGEKRQTFQRTFGTMLTDIVCKLCP